MNVPGPAGQVPCPLTITPPDMANRVTRLPERTAPVDPLALRPGPPNPHALPFINRLVPRPESSRKMQSAAGVGVGVTVGVGVRVGVAVGDGVAVLVAVSVGVRVGVAVGDAVAVGVAVGVGVRVGVAVGNGVAVAVGVSVGAAVDVGVAVGVGVRVGVAVGDAVAVGVAVRVGVAVGMGARHARPTWAWITSTSAMSMTPLGGLASQGGFGNELGLRSYRKPASSSSFSTVSPFQSPSFKLS